MTIDGICDHTVLLPGEEIHQHYTDLLDNAGVILLEEQHISLCNTGNRW